MASQQQAVSVALSSARVRVAERAVAAGMYPTLESFLESAIDEKLARDSAASGLAAELLKALMSGEPILVDDAYLAQKKAERMARLSSANPAT